MMNLVPAFFAVVTITSLIHLLIYILVVGLLVWLALWLISAIPLPEPFNRVATILVYVVAVLIVVVLLLNLIGETPIVVAP